VIVKNSCADAKLVQMICKVPGKVHNLAVYLVLFVLLLDEQQFQK